ncbi:MAG: hypothetical protein P8170_19220, partial [Gemmatimonadota bacterium]
TTQTYTVDSADEGALIVFEVTPVAETGATPGAAVESAAVGPVTAPLLDVTVIEPGTVDAGSFIDVTITGSGFAAGVGVSVENGGGPAPEVSNVVRQDATTIKATITAKSGGPPRDRSWDVRVVNGTE